MQNIEIKIIRILILEYSKKLFIIFIKKIRKFSKFRVTIKLEYLIK